MGSGVWSTDWYGVHYTLLRSMRFFFVGEDKEFIIS